LPQATPFQHADTAFGNDGSRIRTSDTRIMIPHTLYFPTHYNNYFMPILQGNSLADKVQSVVKFSHVLLFSGHNLVIFPYGKQPFSQINTKTPFTRFFCEPCSKVFFLLE
jgi:hypothetical protein